MLRVDSHLIFSENVANVGIVLSNSCESPVKSISPILSKG